MHVNVFLSPHGELCRFYRLFKGDISGQLEINAHYLGHVLAAWSLRGTVSVTPPAASAAFPPSRKTLPQLSMRHAELVRVLQGQTRVQPETGRQRSYFQNDRTISSDCWWKKAEKCRNVSSFWWIATKKHTIGLQLFSILNHMYVWKQSNKKHTAILLP